MPLCPFKFLTAQAGILLGLFQNEQPFGRLRVNTQLCGRKTPPRWAVTLLREQAQQTFEFLRMPDCSRLLPDPSQVPLVSLPIGTSETVVPEGLQHQTGAVESGHGSSAHRAHRGLTGTDTTLMGDSGLVRSSFDKLLRTAGDEDHDTGSGRGDWMH